MSVAWLDEAINSVLAQAYENWELILIDDGSTNLETIKCLRRRGVSDKRISTIHLKQPGGISVASNRGLTEAHGEWISFLDHDDLLEPDALFEIVRRTSA